MSIQILKLRMRLNAKLGIYLRGTSPSGVIMFTNALEMLKQRYTSPNDYNCIEGIRCAIQNNSNNVRNALSDVSMWISSCNNEQLLNELIAFVGR